MFISEIFNIMNEPHYKTAKHLHLVDTPQAIVENYI